MRNLKRALSLAVSTVMLIGMMAVGTSAASYADVDSADNVEAIEVMQAVSVMVGDENGNFNPDKNVTRAEMAVVMANLLDLQVEGDVYLPEGLADALDAVTESILDGEVYYLPGKPLFDKLSLTVDKNLLDAFPDGLTLVSCLNVTLADDLDPADVIDRLAFYDCAKICCRSALQSVVSAVANGTLQIELTDCPDEDEAAPGDLGVNAASYTL